MFHSLPAELAPGKKETKSEQRITRRTVKAEKFAYIVFLSYTHFLNHFIFSMLYHRQHACLDRYIQKWKQQTYSYLTVSQKSTTGQWDLLV